MRSFNQNYHQLVAMVWMTLTLSCLPGCQDNSQSVPANDQNKSVKQASSVVPEANPDKPLSAIEIARKYIIADTHIDLPHRLKSRYEDVSMATEHGDFDYPRAVAGGLDAPFMSIYIPSEYQQKGGSKQIADELIDMVENIVNKSPDKFAFAYTSEQLEENFSNGLISMPMGMENGSPIEGDLNNLNHFYKRGIRYITLTHGLANHISDSSYDTNRPAGGLTDFGRSLIVAMNQQGMMVDVSHISDEAFFQVMEISQAPVIASHSSARFFIPDFERNMSDQMIKQLAENGGVIQINLGSVFISQKSIDNHNSLKAARKTFMQENNLSADSEKVKKFTKQYRSETPFTYATMDEVLDHFEHIINLVGIEHVGIGSDFDGVGDSLPEGLKDVTGYPNLIQGLLDRGYSETDIGKILSGNLLRVWKQVEAYAKEYQKSHRNN